MLIDENLGKLAKTVDLKQKKYSTSSQKANTNITNEADSVASPMGTTQIRYIKKNAAFNNFRKKRLSDINNTEEETNSISHSNKIENIAAKTTSASKNYSTIDALLKS